MVNKVMWEVDRSDVSLEAFKDDPGAFLDDWVSKGQRPVPPYPEGGSLTETERDALAAHDYGYLYAMGVNPFLLWQFARSVSVPGDMTGEELISSFREAVEPHGYPDFHT